MSEITKADYIMKLQAVHSEINTLKDDLKAILEEIKDETDFDGAKLSRIAAKKASGKLVEYTEDLEETLKLIQEE